jgi:hypothetical protein
MQTRKKLEIKPKGTLMKDKSYWASNSNTINLIILPDYSRIKDCSEF